MKEANLNKIYIGCAGWTIAAEHAGLFPGKGVHLERYARLFRSVEINVTFYRLPRADTFVKWANTTPDDFRFAVKLSRSITHQTRLKDHSLLAPFLDHVQMLDNKLGPILIQLPPGLAFDTSIVTAFFEALRSQYSGQLVCEPRHRSWFSPEVEALMEHFRIARVAADPAVLPAAAKPGGWKGVIYYRLHGSPKMYHSSYDETYLDGLAGELIKWRESAPVWCIFDNTASGAAVGNALHVKEGLLNIASGKLPPKT